MNYIDWLNQTIAMPEEAAALCRELCPKIAASGEYPAIKQEFFAGHPTRPTIEAYAEANGMRPRAALLAFAELFSAHTREIYAERGYDESIFVDSLLDLTIWAKVCIRDEGEWGLQEYDWMSGQLRATMFRLGRLQFHLIPYRGEEYSRGGMTVRKGDTVINIHIPEGDPITRDKRLDSYRRAYRFFGEKYHAFTCSSYLFYLKHEEFLPRTSNILDFMHDFYLYNGTTSKSTGDLWRIFGGKRDNWDPATLPRDTGLRRAYADHLAKEFETGHASGVFLFDGENIVK